MELLGEREERLEELREDLQDVKMLYRDQIEYMVEQVGAPALPGAAGLDANALQTP